MLLNFISFVHRIQSHGHGKAQERKLAAYSCFDCPNYFVLCLKCPAVLMGKPDMKWRTVIRCATNYLAFLSLRTGCSILWIGLGKRKRWRLNSFSLHWFPALNHALLTQTALRCGVGGGIGTCFYHTQKPASVWGIRSIKRYWEIQSGLGWLSEAGLFGLPKIKWALWNCACVKIFRLKKMDQENSWQGLNKFLHFFACLYGIGFFKIHS